MQMAMRPRAYEDDPTGRKMAAQAALTGAGAGAGSSLYGGLRRPTSARYDNRYGYQNYNEGARATSTPGRYTLPPASVHPELGSGAAKGDWQSYPYLNQLGFPAQPQQPAAPTAPAGPAVPGIGGGYNGNAGPGIGYGVNLSPRSQAALDAVMAQANAAPVDLNALMGSDAYKQLSGAVQARFDEQLKAGRADLAARGQLRGGAAVNMLGAVNGRMAQELGGLVPQLVNTQLAVNGQRMQNLLSGLEATTGTEGWSLGQERADSALSGNFRGGQTLEARVQAANLALRRDELANDRWYKEQALKQAAQDKKKAGGNDAAEYYLSTYNISPNAAQAFVDFQEWAMQPNEDGTPKSETQIRAAMGDLISSAAFDQQDKSWLNLMGYSLVGNERATTAVNGMPKYRQKPLEGITPPEPAPEQQPGIFRRAWNFVTGQ